VAVNLGIRGDKKQDDRHPAANRQAEMEQQK
jgi:hypothetical protein